MSSQSRQTIVDGFRFAWGPRPALERSLAWRAQALLEDSAPAAQLADGLITTDRGAVERRYSQESN